MNFVLMWVAKVAKTCVQPLGFYKQHLFWLVTCSVDTWMLNLKLTTHNANFGS